MASFDDKLFIFLPCLWL